MNDVSVTTTAPAAAVSTEVELRVLIRGLKLDDTTRSLIDAAIRSAVLQELAAIDNKGIRRIASPGSDPQTRSIFGAGADGDFPGRRPVLGLIAMPD